MNLSFVNSKQFVWSKNPTFLHHALSGASTAHAQCTNNNNISDTEDKPQQRGQSQLDQLKRLQNDKGLLHPQLLKQQMVQTV